MTCGHSADFGPSSSSLPVQADARADAQADTQGEQGRPVYTPPEAGGSRKLSFGEAFRHLAQAASGAAALTQGSTGSIMLVHRKPM